MEYSNASTPTVETAGIQIDSNCPVPYSHRSRNNKDLRMLFEKHGEAGLLRLIQSPHFSPSMALQYLCTIHHDDMLQHIGERLFGFAPNSVSWYLMQLIHLYLYSDRLSPMIGEHLIDLSSHHLKFSLTTTWMLEAYLLYKTRPNQGRLHLLKRLLNSILSYWCTNELRDDIAQFVSERSFITELILISRRLKLTPSKLSKLNRLHSELFALDRSLSCSVFVPMPSLPEHVIVRIPYKDSSVLNSKDKSPYLIYVEVIEDMNAMKNFKNITHLRQTEVEKFINNRLDIVTNEENTSRKLAREEAGYDVDNVASDRSNDSDLLPVMSLESATTGPWTKLCAGDIRRKISRSSAPDACQMVLDQEDPSVNILSERWSNKVERIRSSSPFGSMPGWNLYSIIVKYGDDLRQDYLAYQFLQKCKDIWMEEHVYCWVRPYAVVITENQGGLIEAITNAVSIHQIKSRYKLSLNEYFVHEFGHNTEAYFEAKKQFIRSLAGYSLFQYIFQVKDRHNGNILLDLEGHIIHIDFGYILGQSPKNIAFETSPFKMTSDLIQLMEGRDSDLFHYFKSLMFYGFLALRKHMNKLTVLVDIMKIGDHLACLGKNCQNVDALRARFLQDSNDEQISKFIDKMIYQSTNSVTTAIYDKFQYYTNGIKI